MFYFTFVDNNMTIRALYYSFTLGCCLLHCALELRHAPMVALRFSYWFTASVLALYGFFLLGVRIPLLLQNPIVDMYDPSPAQFVVMIVGVLGGILWTMGFAFMVTQQLVMELNRTATHDFLTETLNRRAAQGHLADSVAKGRDTNLPLSVLLLDIDHFKQVNDRYGHEVGDKVLVAIAQLLRQHVRGNDMVARWGGEEFLVVLQNTNAATALTVAERLTRIISTTPLVLNNATIHCHISIGIATATPPYPSSTALIGAADDALYHAKRTGRNRVAVYSDTLYPEPLPAEEPQPLLELFPTR
jgi:diguanylate cyclase (GGDEF)-like protein